MVCSNFRTACNVMFCIFFNLLNFWHNIVIVCDTLEKPPRAILKGKGSKNSSTVEKFMTKLCAHFSER